MAALEVALQKSKADFLVERYVWIVIVVGMAFAFLSQKLTFFPSFFLALLAVVLLALLAQWWNVPVVTHYLDRIFDRFIPRKLDETE